MKRKYSCFSNLTGIFLLIFIFIYANTFSEAAEPGELKGHNLRIFYSGNMLGYLEPCG